VRQQINILTAIVPVSRMSGKLDNLKSWIFRALDLNIEVILIHDVNDEGTSSELSIIVEEANSRNLVFIEGVFGGPGEARNVGIKIASGKWICFWDSDDVPNVDEIVKLVGSQGDQHEVIAGSYFEVDLKSHKSRFMKLDKDHFERSLSNNLGIWRFIFNRNTINDLTFINTRMGEDLHFICQIPDLKTKIFITEQPIYFYHTNVLGQLTGNKKAITDLYISMRKILELSEENSTKNDLINLFLVRTFITGLKKATLSAKIEFMITLPIIVKRVGFFKVTKHIIMIFTRKILEK
jgi:glycosyltransferase involved in cell wall biosynthesis